MDWAEKFIKTFVYPDNDVIFYCESNSVFYGLESIKAESDFFKVSFFCDYINQKVTFEVKK